MNGIPRKLILVIDQGTHATRALALDMQGRACAAAYRTVTLKRRTSAVVEQDPLEILASAQAVIRQILKAPALRKTEFFTAGLATQRSSVVAWDRRSGVPLSPVISWQDRRTAKRLAGLAPYSASIKRITGLPLSPHYGAGKFGWMLDHLPAVKQARRRGTLALGPLAAFLLFHLLRKRPFVVDHANALRTQLMGLDTLSWDPMLLELFGVPAELLPECRDICHPYGELQAAAIPLEAVNGDQTAALHCLGKPSSSVAVVNVGTGAFVLRFTGEQPVFHERLLSGIAASGRGPRRYVVEGTVNGAGAALEWAARRWHLKAAGGQLDDGLRHAAEPPIFLNTIGGLGSPWWRPGPSPRLIGRGNRRQKTAAVLESILFLLKANIDCIDSAGFPFNRLQISGGLSRVDDFCQRLADLTRLPVYRPAEAEATARGSAWLAAGCPSRWPKTGRGRHFQPGRHAGIRSRYRRFCAALEAG
jgi:glycerol kinase